MSDEAKVTNLDVECCIGCEACHELCPEVFGFNEDDEKAFLITDTGPRECLEEAASTCPEECIEVE
ncbi:MAG: ferredoxin [Desulfovibrionales bacterium]